MRGTDGASGQNLSATPPNFALSGGLYQFNVVSGAWGAGTVTLNALGPDGVTYLAAYTSFTANGGVLLYLAPGQYQVAIAGGTTGVYWSITRVPGE